MHLIIRLLPRIFCITLLFVISVSVLGQDGDKIILTLPEEIELVTGGRTTISGSIICPNANCIGFEIEFTFDPSVIQILDTSVGSFLGEGATELSAFTFIDNDTGHVQIAGFGTAGMIEGVLFLLEIQASTQIGSTELAFVGDGETFITLVGGNAALPEFNIAIIEVVAPTPTPTNTSTQTPTSTPTLTPVSVIMVGDAQIFAGPDVEYSVISSISSGTTIEAIAFDETGVWVLVSYAEGEIGWIQFSRLMDFQGEIDSIPEVTLTPTFTPTASPSRTPSITRTPSLTRVTSTPTAQTPTATTSISNCPATQSWRQGTRLQITTGPNVVDVWLRASPGSANHVNLQNGNPVTVTGRKQYFRNVCWWHVRTEFATGNNSSGWVEEGFLRLRN